MLTINLDELREAEALLAKMAQHAEKIAPVLELIKQCGGKDVLIPPATDRFISRREVAKILKIGTGTVVMLIKRGQLTPLCVADSSAATLLSLVDNA